MFKIAILSHLGELTRDTRVVGDTIRYRIYYSNSLLARSNCVIIDQLDSGLTKITAFNNGVYNRRNHTVTWNLPSSTGQRGKYVELEAVLSQEKLVHNQAVLSVNRRKTKSNIVETNTLATPKRGWVPFLPDAAQGESPRIYMKDETTMGVTLRFDLPGVYVSEQEVEGRIYHRFSLPGCSALKMVGSPELPIIGEIVEVPFGPNFTPEIIEVKSETLTGYTIYPTQLPAVEPPQFTRPFSESKQVYLSDTIYPSQLVTVSPRDIGVIRGHRVLRLKVSPFQYNPVSKQVTTHSMIEVRLNYDKPAQIRGVPNRLRSQPFEDILSAAVINYKEPNRLKPAPEEGQDFVQGCHYLIITHNGFYADKDSTNPVLRWANWKRRKGYTTRVVNVEDIQGGNTPASIQTFIHTAYRTWSPAPSYILIIGDADLINAFPGMHHPDEKTHSGAWQPPIETDLYYTTPEGGDMPSIFIGRIPADSLQQVTDMVDKLLEYEQKPPDGEAHPGFYNDVSLVGLFADIDSNGKEGRPWIANLEAIRDFLLSKNYNVERIFSSEDGHATTPKEFNDGTDLPNDLKHPNYPWDGGAAAISRALNRGNFLITYRAHGNPDSWDEPSFDIADINALNQSHLTPLVFSITCQTGWFDNETDDDTLGGQPANAESFSGSFLRRAGAGAVGVIAMTRNSYTGWNDYLVFGMFKAIWPDFTPQPHWSKFSAPSLLHTYMPRFGQILVFSKLYMIKAEDEGDIRKAELEMQHLFGDPEMPVWTKAPTSIKVVHPRSINTNGTQRFGVKVLDGGSSQPLLNAKVVLTRENSIVQLRETGIDGVAHIELTGGAVQGDLEITVTLLGYRPYLGAITVNPAFINILDPSDGIEGDLIHIGGAGFSPGETVEFQFGGQLQVHTVVADASGEFGQGNAPEELQVPIGFPIGYANILVRGQISDRSAVAGFLVHEKEVVDLWTYNPYDSSTWSLVSGDNPVWDSPDIVLYDRNGTTVASSNLVVGERYSVNVVVRNNSTFAAHQAKAVFRWCNYGAGGPWELLPFNPVKQVNVPASPGTALAVGEFEPHVTGHVCISVTLEHPNDSNFSNIDGQENLYVGEAHSPAKVCFTVWNPTDKATPVFLEVRQIIAPGNPNKERLWASWVQHPEPQILPPGGKGEACVIIDPDVAEVHENTKAKFAVTVFIGRKMIGGVNVNMTKL